MRQKGDETSLTPKPQKPQSPRLSRARRATVHLTRLIPPWHYWMRKRIRLPTVSRLFKCLRLWIRALNHTDALRSSLSKVLMFSRLVFFFFFFLYSPPFLIAGPFLTGSLDFMLTVVETPNLRGQFNLCLSLCPFSLLTIDSD